MPDSAARPVIRLVLGRDRRALVSEVHEASDWVFTVDRNMGIEFFDHGGRRDRPVVVLDQLRSLSGRLALKLVSSPTARAEALGLALARMFLEYQGALRNQIVVPLDAHLDLFHAAKSQAEAIGDEVTVRRTDLALFDLDLANRTITCNLVEVKCYAQKLGLSGYHHLKQQIIEQLNQSEHVIQVHFDPRRVTPDRPDRLLKTRELSILLEFYLQRGLRYGLMEHAAGAEARTFLDLLEDGYTLRFSRSGLVFDFDKSGTEPAEHEAGVEFHRVGADLIRRLVDHAVSRWVRLFFVGGPERSMGFCERHDKDLLDSSKAG